MRSRYGAWRRYWGECPRVSQSRLTRTDQTASRDVARCLHSEVWIKHTPCYRLHKYLLQLNSKPFNESGRFQISSPEISESNSPSMIGLLHGQGHLQPPVLSPRIIELAGDDAHSTTSTFVENLSVYPKPTASRCILELHISVLYQTCKLYCLIWSETIR